MSRNKLAFRHTAVIEWEHLITVLQHFATNRRVDWHSSPPRALYFHHLTTNRIVGVLSGGLYKARLLSRRQPSIYITMGGTRVLAGSALR